LSRQSKPPGPRAHNTTCTPYQEPRCYKQQSAEEGSTITPTKKEKGTTRKKETKTHSEIQHTKLRLGY